MNEHGGFRELAFIGLCSYMGTVRTYCESSLSSRCARSLPTTMMIATIAARSQQARCWRLGAGCSSCCLAVEQARGGIHDSRSTLLKGFCLLRRSSASRLHNLSSMRQRHRHPTQKTSARRGASRHIFQRPKRFGGGSEAKHECPYHHLRHRHLHHHCHSLRLHSCHHRLHRRRHPAGRPSQAKTSRARGRRVMKIVNGDLRR